MPSESRAMCRGPQCDWPTVAKGLCEAHRAQARKGRLLTPVSRIRAKGKCTGPQCARVPVAAGLCGTHAAQRRRAAALTPIRPYPSQPERCTRPGCDRRPHARGLCNAHYQQQREGRALTPIKCWPEQPQQADEHEHQRRCFGPECDRKAGRRTGLCRTHQQQRREGRSLSPIRLSLSPSDRFWAKVDRRGPDECWEWQGYCNNKGYGTMGVARRKHYVHRLVFLFAYGVTLPDDLCSLHSCDNPPCCNPEHLFVGTVADNNADMAAKGRHGTMRGERHPRAILTADDVRAIRRRNALGGVTHRALADEYGVALPTVRSILEGRSWAHI